MPELLSAFSRSLPNDEASRIRAAESVPAPAGTAGQDTGRIRVFNSDTHFTLFRIRIRLSKRRASGQSLTHPRIFYKIFSPGDFSSICFN